ncbi:MAG: peptidoglycan-binding protein [Phormidesmis sp.]
MIRRSTLVLLTCLGALSAFAVPTHGYPSDVVLMAQAESATSNVLSLGARGRAVRALQDRLKETGYYDGEVDGIYGLGTQRSVRAFQEEQGVEPTGRLDDATWESLEALNTSAAPTATETSQSETVVSDRPDAPETSEPELPPIGDRAVDADDIDADAVEREGGGFGRVIGFVLLLSALVASFGGGFFIANRSKLEAAEEDPTEEWGEADPSVGVLNSGVSNGTTAIKGTLTGGVRNGFNGNGSLATVSANQLSTSGQIGGTSAMAQTDVVDGLIKDLHNPDPSQRRKVIWELGQRGNSIAVQPLVDAMVSADSKEKSLVLAALSEIGIRSLKPMNRALAIALKDDNPEVRKNAIRDLTRIYDLVIQISQMLGHATEDEDPEVRQTATWALDQLNRLRRTQDIDTNMRSFTSGTTGGPNRFAS